MYADSAVRDELVGDVGWPFVVQLTSLSHGLTVVRVDSIIGGFADS